MCECIADRVTYRVAERIAESFFECIFGGLIAAACPSSFRKITTPSTHFSRLSFSSVLCGMTSVLNLLDLNDRTAFDAVDVPSGAEGDNDGESVPRNTMKKRMDPADLFFREYDNPDLWMRHRTFDFLVKRTGFATMSEDVKGTTDDLVPDRDVLVGPLVVNTHLTKTSVKCHRLSFPFESNARPGFTVAVNIPFEVPLCMLCGKNKLNFRMSRVGPSRPLQEHLPPFEPLELPMLCDECRADRSSFASRLFGCLTADWPMDRVGCTTEEFVDAMGTKERVEVMLSLLVFPDKMSYDDTVWDPRTVSHKLREFLFHRLRVNRYLRDEEFSVQVRMVGKRRTTVYLTPFVIRSQMILDVHEMVKDRNRKKLQLKLTTDALLDSLNDNNDAGERLDRHSEYINTLLRRDEEKSRELCEWQERYGELLDAYQHVDGIVKEIKALFGGPVESALTVPGVPVVGCSVTSMARSVLERVKGLFCGKRKRDDGAVSV